MKGPGRPTTFCWRVAAAAAWNYASAGGYRRYDAQRGVLPTPRQLLRWRRKHPDFDRVMKFAERVAAANRDGLEITFHSGMGMLSALLHHFASHDFVTGREMLAQANEDLTRVLRRGK